MAKASQAKTQVWRFTEENEWEGERWKVWFEAPVELEEKLKELKALLKEHTPDNYWLKQVDDFPDSYDDGQLEECEYVGELEDGEEECGDCDYCGGAEGYFAPEGEGELNVETLELALEYYRGEGWNGDGQDPLYKLRLFDQ